MVASLALTPSVASIISSATSAAQLEATARALARAAWLPIALACGDFATAKAFWEPLGFVATGEAELPYLHLVLTSDHLDIAFHRPRILDRPMLVFRDQGMRERIAKLRDVAAGKWLEPPPGLSSAANALLEAPEGTALLFLDEES